MSTIAILHPGQMGVSVAAAAKYNGHRVLWVSSGRSHDTRQRAELAGLEEVPSLGDCCNTADIVLSICPPEKAIAQASAVLANGFSGTYVDCNAIDAATSQQIASSLQSTGVQYVDGGIIGMPAWEPDTTRLYLAGHSASEVATLLDGSPLGVRVIGDQPGAASALKMAYAGWTKGSAALLMTMFAMAKAQGVDGELLDEWALSQSGLSAKLNSALVSNAPKAWRFVGEMNEIASSLEHSGLPREWFDAAAKTYERLAEFKNADDLNPDLIVDALNRSPD